MVSQMLDCGYKLTYYTHREKLDDDGLVAEAYWPPGKCKCNVRWGQKHSAPLKLKLMRRKDGEVSR